MDIKWHLYKPVIFIFIANALEIKFVLDLKNQNVPEIFKIFNCSTIILRTAIILPTDGIFDANQLKKVDGSPSVAANALSLKSQSKRKYRYAFKRAILLQL